MIYIFIEKYVTKIKNPGFLIKYVIFSFFLYLSLIFFNYIFICNKITEYFQINNRYSSVLSQYSLTDQYQTAVEIVSSIHNYEFLLLNKFFAAEIWSGDEHYTKDFPKFSSSSFNVYSIKNKIKIIDSLNNNRKDVVVYNNNQLYIGVIVCLYNEHLNKTSYKIILYKKMLDFWFFSGLDFIKSSCILVLLIFISTLLIFGFPKLYFDVNWEKNIEKRAIISIKNLILHSLINQENILKYGNNVDEKISKSIYHNNEAQTLLKNINAS